MSIKPSAITGTGVETDPYIIHNYNELKWCCEDTDAIPEEQTVEDYVYIKVNNNINCSEYGRGFRWNIVCSHACDVNLNNKTIENFYIRETAYMFMVRAKKLYIHNGNLLNIYGDWILRSQACIYMESNASDAITLLKNVSMSIDFSNLNYGCIFGGNIHRIQLTNCTVDIVGTYTRTTTITLLGAAQWYTCDIHVNLTSNGNVVYLLGNSATYPGYALNCRFMGRLQLRNINSASYCVYYSTVRNCVFDVEVLSTTPSTATPSFVYGGGSPTYLYGIYNADKVPNYNFNGTNYIACTTADMDMRVNPNADIVLQEKGFDVIKG